MLRSALLLMVAACGRSSLPPEPSQPLQTVMPGWERRAHFVVINEGRAERLVDFPVLVRLDGSRIDYAAARARGADLRFTLADGTLLAHEVEQWLTSGDSYVWLRVTLDAQSNRDVWMYYGNPAAQSVDNPSAVWRQGYVAVYHFANTSSALSATSATNNGVTFGGTHIGAYATFDGTNAYLSLPSGFSAFAGGLTIEAWVRPTTPRNFARVIDLGNGEATDNIVLYRWVLTEELVYEVHDPGFQFRQAGVLVNGAWQYLAVTHQPDGVATISRDAIAAGSRTGVPLPSAVTRTSNFIGRSNWAVDDLYQGDMDELRISNVPRSSAWLDAQYASMTGEMVVFDED